MQKQGPFSIPYLEAQVTWIFTSKSLDHFLSSLQVTWEPSHLAKSQVTLVADLEISWIAQTSLFVILYFSIHICGIIWYVLQYMYERQSELSSLMNYVFDATGSGSIVGYLLVRGLLWCCIQWRHYRVDAWRHNSVDADAWRRQQCIARKTIGCVPK